MRGLYDRDEVRADGFDKCKEITRRYGTSYFFAMQFFPKDIREAIYAIYAFARIPDEIVDDPNKKSRRDSLAKLGEWRKQWLDAVETGESNDPVLLAISAVFRKYKIPMEDGEAFLASMFMDEEKSSYETFEELEKYMYGSAGVIGLMITRIVGYTSDEAFPYAIKLGYAFQLTNFLRDIKEDCEDLNRIYMPINDLQRFDLCPDNILNERFDDNFRRFMKFQIKRNRKIYREALPGIKLLNWRGRMAVRVSYVLYKAILNEIERENYNIFKGRVRTNLRQKLWLTTKAFAGLYE